MKRHRTTFGPLFNLGSFGVASCLTLLLGVPVGGCGGGDDGGDDGAGARSGGTSGDPTGGAGNAPGTGGAAGTGGSTDGGGGAATPNGWLYTEGARIYRSDGTVFHGRGANIHDTRSCWACAWFEPDPEEVIRRIDTLTGVWGANFMRLALESYGSGSTEQAGGALQWGTVLEDPAYLADIKAIVDHIGEIPGAVVLLSIWTDPTQSELGWPTDATREIWRTLVDTFRDSPHVMFGITNEPAENFDGAQDAAVWEQMNLTVETIRQEEARLGSPQHIITVQGTGGWARRMEYYVEHPITAFGGANVAYEVHVYNPPSEFDAMFVEPSATIPIVIGEFGPAEGYMTEADCSALMEQAEAVEVPYLAWTFHPRCGPGLVVDNTNGGCGVGMDLQPTSWGSLLMDRLAQPW